MKHSTFTLGSVSSGTMRSVDLAEAFCAELEYRGLLDAATSEYPEVLEAYNSGTLADLDDNDPETLDLFVNESAFETLGENLPDYIYFGSHPGDGADFGYWIAWESVEEDIQFSELPSGSELPEHNRGLFAVISDHGNVTLYDDETEVWSIV